MHIYVLTVIIISIKEGNNFYTITLSKIKKRVLLNVFYNGTGDDNSKMKRTKKFFLIVKLFCAFNCEIYSRKKLLIFRNWYNDKDTPLNYITLTYIL